MDVQDAVAQGIASRLADLFSRAQDQLAKGNLGAAAVTRDEIEARYPGSEHALRITAMLETHQGRFLAASKTLAQLLQMRPEDSEARDLQAEVASLLQQSLEHPYTKRFLENRAIHMDYPRTISIETTGRCNAKCNFCPAPELERRAEAMADDLFWKIIEDIRAIPEHVPVNINTNLVNEPFMDKKMFARLRYINEHLPKARLQIYSNFNVLPKNFTTEFRRLRNIGSLNISFNAANKGDYEAVMHIDFDRTVRHLKKFMDDNRQDRYFNRPVILSRVADNTRGDQEFPDQCRAIFAGYEEDVDYRPYVKRRVTWLGDSHVEQAPVPYFLPCDAWLDINIMCTGIVPLCCLDAKADYAIGDIKKSSLLEIYNSPGFRKLRENHLQRESLNPCGACSPYAAFREDPRHVRFRELEVPLDAIRPPLSKT